MAYERSVAIYDACVLYPFHLRNVLIQCAVDGLVKARWTNEIHSEWIRSLSANNPAIPIDLLYATRDLMDAVLPDATVDGYQSLIPTITLPDANDRHVVAAAIAGKASLILTWNLRDFPAAELRKHGLKKQTPDIFLSELYEQMPDLMVQVLAGARRNLRRSLISPVEFVTALRRQSLVRLTAKISPRLKEL